MFKRVFLVGAIAMLAGTVLISPSESQARSVSRDELVVRLVPPLVFSDGTTACPEGVAQFDVSSDAGRGSGSACFLSVLPVTPCTADLCQVVASVITFSLPGGTIAIDTQQLETDIFDPVSGSFTIQVRLEGTVAQATGRLHKLAGMPVAGGGTTTFASNGSTTTTVAFVIEGDWVSGRDAGPRAV